jgi:hypothetical protein
MEYTTLPALAPVLAGADHVDVKTAAGDVTLRQFLAAMLTYQPRWITALYHVRRVFVRFLGMRQAGVPRPPRLRPEDVPMLPGSRAATFTVRLAEEDHYWVAEATGTHLTAALAVVAHPLSPTRRRFEVVTVVHYHSWAGPVYFTVIRPFHHLVVGSMVRAGVHGVGVESV